MDRSEVDIDGYREAIAMEFPKVRFVEKESDPFSRCIDRVLRVLTLGAQSSYSSRYVTTIGQTIYLPRGWYQRSEVERYVVLRHEVVHLRQFRRWGLVGMTLLYLIPFFPMGLAYGRARLEWEAYEETLRATAETAGLAAAKDPVLHAHIVRQFVSGAYGWMWPFPGQVRRWIAEALTRIEGEMVR